MERDTTTVEAIPWRCELCGCAGIVNALEMAPGFVGWKRARDAHAELAPDCPGSLCFDD